MRSNKLMRPITSYTRRAELVEKQLVSDSLCMSLISQIIKNHSLVHSCICSNSDDREAGLYSF